MSNVSYFGNDRYTRLRCVRQCETDIIHNSCGCKDAYMPGPFPVCTLAKFLDCVGPTMCKILMLFDKKEFIYTYCIDEL